MSNFSASLDLGSIVCKHCHEMIGTFDAEKVIIYYSDCQEHTCLKERQVGQGEQMLEE
ncbi:GapA-binding peptide SR1P [Paenibacillus puerhi]|uniref:GapA-binding peptide SR1P n=1 Tax=Paenibacillus puerhi TaxID=2692622 RepID=UPI001F47F80B|nr:GapA-binding peptide SR1P [Paenibacillus puerhi]